MAIGTITAILTSFSAFVVKRAGIVSLFAANPKSINNKEGINLKYPTLERTEVGIPEEVQKPLSEGGRDPEEVFTGSNINFVLYIDRYEAVIDEDSKEQAIPSITIFYFNPLTTTPKKFTGKNVNGKEPISVYGMSNAKYKELLKAKSKGKWYLDNVAKKSTTLDAKDSLSFLKAELQKIIINFDLEGEESKKFSTWLSEVVAKTYAFDLLMNNPKFKVRKLAEHMVWIVAQKLRIKISQAAISRIAIVLVQRKIISKRNLFVGLLFILKKLDQHLLKQRVLLNKISRRRVAVLRKNQTKIRTASGKGFKTTFKYSKQVRTNAKIKALKIQGKRDKLRKMRRFLTNEGGKGIFTPRSLINISPTSSGISNYFKSRVNIVSERAIRGKRKVVEKDGTIRKRGIKERVSSKGQLRGGAQQIKKGARITGTQKAIKPLRRIVRPLK